MTTKKVNRRPGYDPGSGRPDPNEEHIAVVDERMGTHVPGTEGPPCGLRPAPSDPSAYNAISPTCPTCKHYKERAEAVTRGIVARSKARAAAVAKGQG